MGWKVITKSNVPKSDAKAIAKRYKERGRRTRINKCKHGYSVSVFR